MNRQINPPIIMVEGNIGAGKSTFLKVLSNHLDVEIIFEPTDKWQNASEDENLLHLFYKDTQRWAYTFQSYAFISRISTILEFRAKNKSSKVQLLERSIYCDRFCFAKNCYESGLMSPVEWNIYKEWFSWLSEKYTPIPNGFIYLKTEPETCYQRVLKRRRPEEASLDLAYLKQLHQKHDDWLIKQKELMPHLRKIPILTLDCNREFETNASVQKMHARSVEAFLIQKVPTFRCQGSRPTQTQF